MPSTFVYQAGLDNRLQAIFSRFGKKCDKQDAKFDIQSETFDQQHEELVGIR